MKKKLPLHDLFFWVASFFLLGVLFGSATQNFSYKFIWILAATLVLFALLRLRAGVFTPSPNNDLKSHLRQSLLGAGVYLLILFFIGALYFHIFDYFQKHPIPVFDQKIKFNATVEKVDLKIDGQELTVKTDSPEINPLTQQRFLTEDRSLLGAGVKLKIETFRYPTFNYGDYVEVEGKINKSKSEFINGVVYKPSIKLIEGGHGFWLKSKLLKIRNDFENNLKKVLPYNQAVFLSFWINSWRQVGIFQGCSG